MDFGQHVLLFSVKGLSEESLTLKKEPGNEPKLRDTRVFDNFCRFPHVAEAACRGFSMTQFVVNDASTHRVTMAMRGTVTIINTGFDAVDQWDILCWSLPPRQIDRLKAMQTGKNPQGKIFPMLYPARDQRHAAVTADSEMKTFMLEAVDKLRQHNPESTESVDAKIVRMVENTILPKDGSEIRQVLDSNVELGEDTLVSAAYIDYFNIYARYCSIKHKRSGYQTAFFVHEYLRIRLAEASMAARIGSDMNKTLLNMYLTIAFNVCTTRLATARTQQELEQVVGLVLKGGAAGSPITIFFGVSH